MIFSSLQYLIFLPIVVLLYWRTTGGVRLALVVLSSYFFYMSWFPVYGLLLLFLTFVNWLLAGRLANIAPESTAQRRALLTGGLLLNLGCLCYYKYTNFILTNVFQLFNWSHKTLSQLAGNAGAVDAMQAPVLKVLLPLGISFFVFEFVHYIVDVYHGSKPIKSFMEFAAFASFFPSQIAGPIKRYQDFNEKLKQPEPWSSTIFFEGMTLILQGLFKKVAIADPIGLLIHTTFTHAHVFSQGDALLAAVGFVAQVYCDFSGYTDIGRGSALLLGIRLPENFNLPYLSHDLADFWRRWHMSLGTWLRDYVYIPLGGSRTGRYLNMRNLFLTMVACGLWHGASWHYVIFGAMQGIGLCVNREWKGVLKAVKPLGSAMETPIGKWFGTFLTMLFITVTFVVFRAPDMPHALVMLQSAISGSGMAFMPLYVLRSGVLQFTGIYMMFWFLNELANRKPAIFGSLVNQNAETVLRFSPQLRFASWTAALILTVAARPTEAIPFVYFQF
jgi:D-alanyl-lipoteichoic acid acyltransferase DltB (MBOAT superfamily)